MGTKKENWMERTYIESGRRSTSKESTRRNPCRKEKPRSTVEKMDRRTGLNKPPAYIKRRRKRRNNKQEIWVAYTGTTCKPSGVKICWFVGSLNLEEDTHTYFSLSLSLSLSTFLFCLKKKHFQNDEYWPDWSLYRGAYCTGTFIARNLSLQ